VVLFFIWVTWERIWVTWESDREDMCLHFRCLLHLVLGLVGRCVLKFGVWESVAERGFGVILQFGVWESVAESDFGVIFRVLVGGEVRWVICFVCEVQMLCVGSGIVGVCRWE